VEEQLAVIRRWVYCRCTYARAPTAPCVCTEADIRRAERETPAQTRAWERRLAGSRSGGRW
jgi:hypothetical protein